MYKIFTTDRRELKKLKQALQRIIKESPVAGTVDKTIKQVQAAIIAAVTASAIATSTSGSN